MAQVQVAPGLLLGRRYRLDGHVATGGMGEVWRATDLLLERSVAVKLMLPAHALLEEDLTRFRAEAQHAGSLSHPGIAQVYDYSEAAPPDPPYLVMELVDGPSLARLLDEGPLDPARTLGLIAQAARALQAAHAAGLVHRDIKPGNMLVTRTGHVKITDFGIALATGSTSVTSPQALIGSPAYLAPERAAGGPAIPASDLYGLGVVAFQCLTGTLPFHGPPLAVALAHRERPLPPLPASVPADVAALVAALTAKDPRARPASAGEVAQRAEHLLEALNPAAALAAVRPSPDATRPIPAVARQRERPSGRSARPPAYAALAATALALIAATGWAVAAVHGPPAAHPQSGLPAASQHASPQASHPAGRAAPSRGTGFGSTAQAPAPGPASTAPRRSPAPTARPAVTHAPARTPAPTQAPASAAPTPTGTMTSGTPAPTETPTSGTPAPTGTASPTGAPTSGAPTPAPSSSPATRAGA